MSSLGKRISKSVSLGRWARVYEVKEMVRPLTERVTTLERELADLRDELERLREG